VTSEVRHSSHPRWSATPFGRRTGLRDLAAIRRILADARPNVILHLVARVGDFGEIGLVVAKGQIKFSKITCSESLAERPGTWAGPRESSSPPTCRDHEDCRSSKNS